MKSRLSPAAVRRLIDLARPLASTSRLPDSDSAVPDYGNKFQVLAMVGRGGMGTVFEAVYRDFPGLRVALKVLAKGEVADFESRHWFAQEGHVATRLVHPNIPRILEIHRSYLAMQFVDGRTLADLEEAGIDEPERRVRLVRDAALAVHYAHQQGLVHRDLKPQNLMVAAADRVWVMDFGLAKRMGWESSIAGRVLGTPAYMAPEQAAGEDSRVGVCSDVYALGATLFELLARRPPFPGRDREAILAQVVSGAPVPDLREFAPEIGQDLAATVAACLHRDPERRPPSAYGLSRELSAWLGRPATSAGRERRRRARSALDPPES